MLSKEQIARSVDRMSAEAELRRKQKEQLRAASLESDDALHGPHVVHSQRLSARRVKRASQRNYAWGEIARQHREEALNASIVNNDPMLSQFEPLISSNKPPSSASAASEIIKRRAESIFEEHQDSPIVVLVEMLPSDYSRETGTRSTWHDATKYVQYAMLIQEQFENMCMSPYIQGEGIQVKVVQTESTAAPIWSLQTRDRPADEPRHPSQLRPTNLSHASATPSRLGAFEVYLVARYAPNRTHYEQLHSKLTSKTWPHLPTLFKRIYHALDLFWADSGLYQTATRRELEQEELRNDIERWGAGASAQTLAKARTRLAAIVAHDHELDRLMGSMGCEEVVKELRSQVAAGNGSVSKLAAGEAALASYETSTGKLQAVIRRAGVDAKDVVEAIDRWRTSAGDDVLARAEAKLLSLNAADEALETAMSASPRELAQLQASFGQHGERASGTVRAQMATLVSQVEAADSELMRWRWSAMGRASYEARELRAAIEQHGPKASKSVLSDLVDIEDADDALREALGRKPLDATELQASLDQLARRASTSVCLHVERQLGVIQAADTAIMAAMAGGTVDALELKAAIDLHGPVASASVLKLAKPKLALLEAADETLHRMMRAESFESAGMLEEALSEHGPSASASVRRRVEDKLSEIRSADTALKAAMAKLPAEARDLDAAIELYGSSASTSLSQATASKAKALKSRDMALQEVLAATPQEATSIQAGLEEHGPHASASVVALAAQKLHDMMAADDALQSARALQSVEEVGLKAAIEELAGRVSFSALKMAETKLSELRENHERMRGADRALRAAMARPVEAADMMAALDKHGSLASTNMKAEVERLLTELQSEAVTLRSAMSKLPREAKVLASAIELHEPRVSPSVLQEAKGVLYKTLAADTILLQLAPGAGIQEILSEHGQSAGMLEEALSEHGPSASASVRRRVEDKLSEIRSADTALKAAMAKLPAEARDLDAAIELYGSSASTSLSQATASKAKALKSRDMALQEVLAATPQEATSIQAGLEEHGPHASASVVALAAQKLHDMMAADDALRTMLALPPSRWKKRVTQDGAAMRRPGPIAKAAEKEDSERRNALLERYADISAAVQEYGPFASHSIRSRASDTAVKDILDLVDMKKRDLKDALQLHGDYLSDDVKNRLLAKTKVGQSDKLGKLWPASLMR